MIKESEDNWHMKLSRKNSFDAENEEEKEKQTNLLLEKEYLEEIQITKGNNLGESRKREEIQNREMDETLMSLNEQLEKAKKEYQQIIQKISKDRFFKEYSVMEKEAEGAKTLNGKLLKELQKKKIELQKLKELKE